LHEIDLRDIFKLLIGNCTEFDVSGLFLTGKIEDSNIVEKECS